MSVKIEAMRDLITTTTEYLKAWGIEIPDELKQRDRREPGRKMKEETEDRIFKALKKRWRKQAQYIRDRVAFITPDRKVIAPPYEQIIEDSFEDDTELIAEMVRILKDAARNGFKLFGANLPFDIDWTMVNTEAAKWAREYTAEWIKGINKTTRQSIGEAIANFIETPGATLGDLFDDISQWILSEDRALSIAVTETTRAYAESTLIAGQEIQKQYPDVRVVKTWFTNNDDKVCDICAPLDGMEVELMNGFTTEEGSIEGLMDPPAHINCRCWMSTNTQLADLSAEAAAERELARAENEARAKNNGR